MLPKITYYTHISIFTRFTIQFKLVSQYLQNVTHNPNIFVQSVHKQIIRITMAALHSQSAGTKYLILTSILKLLLINLSYKK